MNDVQSLRRYRQTFYPQKNVGFGSGPKPIKKTNSKIKIFGFKKYFIYIKIFKKIYFNDFL